MSAKKLSDSDAQELIDQYNSNLRKLEFQVEQTRDAIGKLKIAAENAKAIMPKKGPGRGRPAAIKKAAAASSAGTKTSGVKAAKAPKAKVAKSPRVKVEKAPKAKAAKAPRVKVAKAAKAPRVKVAKAAKAKAAKAPRVKAERSGDAPRKGRTPLNTQWDLVISDNIGTRETPMTNADLMQVLKTAREKQYIPNEGDTKLLQRLNASLTKLFKQKKIGKVKVEGQKSFHYFKVS